MLYSRKVSTMHGKQFSWIIVFMKMAPVALRDHPPSGKVAYAFRHGFREMMFSPNVPVAALPEECQDSHDDMVAFVQNDPRFLLFASERGDPRVLPSGNQTCISRTRQRSMGSCFLSTSSSIRKHLFWMLFRAIAIFFSFSRELQWKKFPDFFPELVADRDILSCKSKKFLL